jgi:hypothetical protein
MVMKKPHNKHAHTLIMIYYITHMLKSFKQSKLADLFEAMLLE